MPAIRAVAYYRKSNEDDGNSIDQQREWARGACQREGLELVCEFADQAKKGHETATRTAFHEMLKFCQDQARRHAPIQAVVCWHPDRFSRSDSLETSKFLFEFREAGAGRMLTAQKWIDFNRPEDRMLSGIEQEAGAHKFVTDLAKATTRGRIAAASDGRWAGGPIPFAYRAEREEVVVKGQRRLRPKRLVLGPDWEVRAVRLIFDLYANTPKGLQAVAAELTRRGVPTAKGRGGWTVSAVKRVLTNPAYLGRIRWNKNSCGKFVGVIDGRAVDRPAGRGRVRPNDRGQWVGKDDRHEPVVDLATFERCQAKLSERGGAGGRPRRMPTRGSFVLTGLIRCAHCGRAMVGRTDATGRRVYFCGGYNACGADACHYNAVDADGLAKALLRKLRAAWTRGGNLDKVREEVMRQDAAELKAGDGRADALGRRLRQLDKDLAAGIGRLRSIDPDLLDGYQVGLKALQKEKSEAEAELKRIEDTPDAKEDLLRQVDAAVAVLRRLEAAVDAVTGDDAGAGAGDDLRAVLSEVVTRIEVWFSHEPYGKRTRCKFLRAPVYVREDVALVYTGVLNPSGPGIGSPTPGSSSARRRSSPRRSASA